MRNKHVLPNNILIYFVSILSFIVLFASCNKYEEGPFISLISKINRITGDYELSEYYIIVDENEFDLLEQNNIQEILISFDKNGSGNETIIRESGNVNREFEWRFDENKSYIHERTKIGENQFTEWITNKKIIRLSKNDLWLSTIHYDEEIIMKYIKL
jgi:hypothetical protein